MPPCLLPPLSVHTIMGHYQPATHRLSAEKLGSVANTNQGIHLEWPQLFGVAAAPGSRALQQYLSTALVGAQVLALVCAESQGHEPQQVRC